MNALLVCIALSACVGEPESALKAAVIERGDVVHLKSGGPEMTVEYLRSANCGPARVVWLDAGGHAHEREFPLHVLEKRP